MVEKLTWKKLAWELAFFLRTMGFSRMDIRLSTLVTAGCYGIAARLASTQPNAFVRMVVG